jgi:pimeloyl-ACP methyl ester carboxylesterase
VTGQTKLRQRIDPYHPRPDPTAADGPDPYGNRDPEWLEVNWREHLQTAEVGDTRVNYVELGPPPGEQDPQAIVFVHGLSGCWQNWLEQLPHFAREHRVIALDLPGFGESPKPVDAPYDFEFFEDAIDAFLAEQGIDRLGIAVHDVGGPIGVHWALHRPDRVTHIALLNTLIYPEFSEAVLQFIEACTNPAIREQLTSPPGLEAAMRLGVADESKLSDEVFAAVSAPFQSEDDRLALAAAGVGLQPEGFADIAARLPSVAVPFRVIYGEQDRILPDIAETAARVKRDVPHAEITALPGCGHFLQEEEPAEIGQLLADFFAP